MGIGTSVFLIALGAILTFAVNASIGGLDLDVVGWILMAAGVLGLIFTSLIWGNRRRPVVTTEPTEPVDTTERVERVEPVGYRRVVERREVDPPL